MIKIQEHFELLVDFFALTL